jgi:predicted permease
MPRVFRSLGRTPVFLVASVTALGLGIGASAALFSVLDTVFARPLPYASQERLVVVDAEKDGQPTIPSYLQFVDWRARGRSFEGMGYAVGDAFLVHGTERTEATAVAMVTGGFFRVLGATPIIGRLPAADEEMPGATPVILISQRLWLRQFGGDPSIIGRTFETDKGGFVIIGVMATGVGFPSWASAWTPLAPIADRFPVIQQRDWRADARAIGRLKSGIDIGQAQNELTGVARSLAREFAADAGVTAHLTPLVTFVVGDIHQPMLLLTGAVVVLLLIACANVGTLSLVRGRSRANELAIRSALGASRRRIVRLLLEESAVLSFCGAIVGWLLADCRASMSLVLAGEPSFSRRSLRYLLPCCLGSYRRWCCPVRVSHRR